LSINELSSSLRDSKFHSFSDDWQVYLTGERGNLTALANRVKSELAMILTWSRTIGQENLRPCLLSIEIHLEVYRRFFWRRSRLSGAVV
jgi:hypothetical protein